MTELSNKLREARLALGLSLDDVQATTKIQKRYLQGIEDGDFSMMPGPFYVRAFIKQYAEAVHLDPEQLFEEYKTDIPNNHSNDLPEKLSRIQTRKTTTPNNSKIFDIFPKLVIGLFVIGVSVFVYTLVVQNNKSDNAGETVQSEGEKTIYSDVLAEKEKAKETSDSKGNAEINANDTEPATDAKDETPKQELALIETTGRETTFELKNATKFELKIVSTGATWVNILNGQGKSFWQGTLKKGGEESKIQDLTSEQEAIIVVGNSTETEIYVNDQKVEYATPPATQVRQDITIRYAKQEASQ